MSRRTEARARYSLFDKTAAGDAQASMPGVQPFSDYAELNDEERTLPPWATLETNEWLLDGTRTIFPDDMASAFTGVWSAEKSGADGAFGTPPVLTVAFSEAHTSAGITLIFSEGTGDWCDRLTIRWSGKDGGTLAEVEYRPDRANYFCAKQVLDYYGLRITFHSANRPGRYLKLSGVRYGVLMELGGSRLISCRVLEEVDRVSAEVRVNTMTLRMHAAGGEFDLLDLTGAYILFQQRQRVEVSELLDGVKLPMGTFYLDEPRSDADDTVTLSCIDLVGVMGDTEYLGGYWPDGIPAERLVAGIMASAGMEGDYELSGVYTGVVVRGYLPVCTHREALQQVAFVLGAAVDCARSDKIKIVPPSTAEPKAVPTGRKAVGHTQRQDPLITGVEVYVHSYTRSDSATKLLDEPCKAGTRLVKFTSPAAGLSCTGAVIAESGVNYAKLTVAAAGAVVLTGYTYTDSTSLAGSVYMEDLPANAKINVKVLDACTLSQDPQALARRVYDDDQRRVVDVGDVILADEEAGDPVTLGNSGGKALTGVAEQLDIDLTGGFIAGITVRGGEAT